MKTRKFPYYTLFVSLIAAISAFLFGYHTAIISGALLLITEELSLSIFQQEVVVSILLLGCIVGALWGGVLADQMGRKKTLVFTLGLYLVGTLLLFLTRDFLMLLAGRVIGGVAIGIASAVVPVYIAEMSPTEKRGMMVSLNQLMITIGIFISYVVAYLYLDAKEWRLMFAVALLPIALQAVGLFFIPETPAFLLSQGKKQKAGEILKRIWGKADKGHLVEMEDKMDHPRKVTLSSIFGPKMRAACLVGIGISVVQQITGINTVIYYAPHIFAHAGFSSHNMDLLATLCLGAIMVVMTFVGLCYIDKVGRRTLAISGLSVMTIALAVMATFLLFNSPIQAPITIISLLIYIAAFSIGLGVVAWPLISEIFPLGIRGRAVGVATFANWATNYLVSATFLTLIEIFGLGGTYILYTAISLLCIYFLWKKIPETKGKTFEEIQKFWQKKR
ncbi:MAG: sugar porter family MFS transporter [Verrucomicrobia bacterium]|nr:sugar porter family MFS transporter [Verrucomicrobiota bacterium]